MAQTVALLSVAGSWGGCVVQVASSYGLHDSANGLSRADSASNGRGNGTGGCACRQQRRLESSAKTARVGRRAAACSSHTHTHTHIHALSLAGGRTQVATQHRLVEGRLRCPGRAGARAVDAPAARARRQWPRGRGGGNVARCLGRARGKQHGARGRDRQGQQRRRQCTARHGGGTHMRTCVRWC